MRNSNEENKAKRLVGKFISRRKLLVAFRSFMSFSGNRRREFLNVN